MNTPLEQQAKTTSNKFQFMSRLGGGDSSMLPVFLSLILIWVVFDVINTNFLSGRNLSNLILQIAEIGMLAIGETFILLLGEIDLSIAAISGISGAVLALLAANSVNPWVCILAAIASGVVIGGFQGLWVTMIGVPAFIVTLAGSLGYLGLLLLLIGQEGTVPIMNQTLLNITSAYLAPWQGWLCVVIVAGLFTWNTFRTIAVRRKMDLPGISTAQGLMRSVGVLVAAVVVVLTLNSYQGIPVAGFILFIFVALFAFVTQSTSFGRHVYALGGNSEASRRAGINVRTMKIIVFTLSGSMGAIGGIIGASRLGAASTSAGGGDLLLDSIAAAVIGGTSLFGGRGSVWNALLGAIVIGSIENGMDLLSAPSSTKYLVEGGILLVAVTVDTLTRRRRQRRGR